MFLVPELQLQLAFVRNCLWNLLIRNEILLRNDRAVSNNAVLASSEKGIRVRGDFAAFFIFVIIAYLHEILTRAVNWNG